MTPHTPHTDIQQTHFLYRVMPHSFAPYLSLMRLDRPIGTWLLLLPAWWSIAMAAGGVTFMNPAHIYLFMLFGLGAVIMRGAGCVINDLWDRDFDKAVERTQSRPLASGAISPRHAIFFLAGLLCAGLGILLTLSPMAITLGVLSLIPVVLYPLAKRVTWYPQAILGLTFNFGALMGAASVTNTISLAPALLYMAGFFWTMGYDTIYAHQDIADDGTIGVKSTARKFGDKSPVYISVFYALTALMIFYVGQNIDAGTMFYIFWAIASLHLLWQIYTWSINDPTSSLRIFRSNRDFGFILLAAFLLA